MIWAPKRGELQLEGCRITWGKWNVGEESWGFALIGCHRAEEESQPFGFSRGEFAELAVGCLHCGEVFESLTLCIEGCSCV